MPAPVRARAHRALARACDPAGEGRAGVAGERGRRLPARQPRPRPPRPRRGSRSASAAAGAAAPSSRRACSSSARRSPSAAASAGRGPTSTASSAVWASDWSASRRPRVAGGARRLAITTSSRSSVRPPGARRLRAILPPSSTGAAEPVDQPVPVGRADEHDREVADLAGLAERRGLEQLVEQSQAAREHHEGARVADEPLTLRAKK